MNKQNKNIVAVAVAALIIGGAYMLSQSKSDDVSVPPYEVHPSEVVSKLDNRDDVVLLDVRTPAEYGEVHLAGATLLPVQELTAEALAAVGLGEEMRDKEIIIYCRSGNRSKTAYDIMKELGYTNIKSVAGGMNAWVTGDYSYTETGVYTK